MTAKFGTHPRPMRDLSGHMLWRGARSRQSIRSNRSRTDQIKRQGIQWLIAGRDSSIEN